MRRTNEENIIVRNIGPEKRPEEPAAVLIERGENPFMAVMRETGLSKPAVVEAMGITSVFGQVGLSAKIAALQDIIDGKIKPNVRMMYGFCKAAGKMPYELRPSWRTAPVDEVTLKTTMRFYEEGAKVDAFVQSEREKRDTLGNATSAGLTRTNSAILELIEADYTMRGYTPERSFEVFAGQYAQWADAHAKYLDTLRADLHVDKGDLTAAKMDVTYDRQVDHFLGMVPWFKAPLTRLFLQAETNFRYMEMIEERIIARERANNPRILNYSRQKPA